MVALVKVTILAIPIDYTPITSRRSTSICIINRDPHGPGNKNFDRLSKSFNERLCGFMAIQRGLHHGNRALGDGDEMRHRRLRLVIIFASQMTFDFRALFIQCICAQRS